MAFEPSSFLVKPVEHAWERRQAMALRERVFCQEQGLFAGSDRDRIDGHCTLLCAVAEVAGMPDQVVGTVRIHEQRPGCWYGSRLAVTPDLRRAARLGSALIELAVRTAHGQGAQLFLAHVQQQNVALFERLHWQPLEAVMRHGRPHVFMRADLAWYPPLPVPMAGLLRVHHAAA